MHKPLHTTGLSAKNAAVKARMRQERSATLSAAVTSLRGKLEWIMMENARSYGKRGGSDYTVRTNDLHEDKYINC